MKKLFGVLFGVVMSTNVLANDDTIKSKLLIGCNDIYAQKSSNITPFILTGSSDTATILSCGYRETPAILAYIPAKTRAPAVEIVTSDGWAISATGSSTFTGKTNSDAIAAFGGLGSSVAIRARAGVDGIALAVDGKMTKQGSEVIKNLNAEMVGGITSDKIVTRGQQFQLSIDGGATWITVKIK